MNKNKPKIKALSQQTINQIAAGEIIENPASVVKELIENAIDAGALRIVIEVKGGGLQLIRVSDNGCGMSREDAFLSLQRHTTSKIVDVEDLQTLQTMGFRGEALASIAAISKFTLTTAGEGLAGLKIEVEGGQIVAESPCARTQGTTFEVSSLFYNVPARKKFQKSLSANNVEIHKVVSCLSLAHPEVAFELISQDQTVFSVFPSQSKGLLESLHTRIMDVLGDTFLSSAMSIDDREGEYHISGYLGSVAMTRYNRTGQYLFINRRLVFSPLISFAVKDAYGTRIDKERYPVYILHLQMPPHLVDVNVHPQKKEVRFPQESLLKKVVQDKINKGLMGSKSGVPSAFESPLFSPLSAVPFDDFPSVLEFREEPFSQLLDLPLEMPVRAIGIFKHILFLDAETVKGCKPGVLLVDLKSVREKLALESFSEDSPKEFQELLVPISVNLPSFESKELERHLNEIGKLGLLLKSIGKNAFLIEAIPPFLDIEVVQETVLALAQGEANKLKILCRFAREKKIPFTIEEGLEIWKRLCLKHDLHDRQFLSVNGQPLTTHLTIDAFQNLFKI